MPKLIYKAKCRPQDDRLLKQLVRRERRKQERIRLLIETENILRLSA